MSLSEQILDSLGDLGYSSTITESVETLEQSLQENIVEFSKLVSNLTGRLKRLSNMEEFVNSIESPNEKNTFYLELCAMLKELSCPYKSLVEGPIEERFSSLENKQKLLDFLLSEVQAAQILAARQPQTDNFSHLKSDESEETKALKKILITLGFPKPPLGVTANEIWSKVETKCKELLSKLPKSYLGMPLFNRMLDDEQWKKLLIINQALCDDFQMRRELLLTRLDVTVQSFKWADRLKQSNQEISNMYQQKRKELSVRPNIKIYQILAARDDLCKQEKTCSSRLMTKSQLHKIIIPKVPDRGGRTGELEPPPPEMPAFMQRKVSANPQDQRHQHQGGGGGRGGGGRHNQNSNKWANEGYRKQSDFDRYQNENYQGGQGGGYQGGGGSGRGGRGGYRGGGGGGHRY